jgi:hypothetical protein
MEKYMECLCKAVPDVVIYIYIRYEHLLEMC